jgi:hypothetical protein
MSPDDVANAVLACMRLIDTERAYPKLIPRNMAQKVNVCSDVATRIKQLGYKGELSYDDLVYPNQRSSRDILQFLVDELPETVDEEPVTNGDPTTYLRKSIKAELEAVIKETWTHIPRAGTRRPNYAEFRHLSTNPLRSAYIPGPKSSRNAPTEQYIREYLDFITDQPLREQDVVPSILEHNLSTYVEEKEREDEWNRVRAAEGGNYLQWKQKKLAGISRMVNESLRESIHASQLSSSLKMSETLAEILGSWDVGGKSLDSKFQRDVGMRDTQDTQSTGETDEELKARRQRELEELDAILARTREETEELEKAIATFTSSIRQIEADSNTQELRKQELQRKYMVTKKTFDLLPDADNNIAKLREIADRSARRLVELATEWEKHRQPLIDEIRSLKLQLLNRKDESGGKIEEMKKMKLLMKDILDEIRKKNENLKELLEYYKSLPKDINRAVYTRRILDIVKNVKKQKGEINKILIDIRNVMKEITLSTSTLTRSYAVTDNRMFADAKKDEMSKQAYKDLVAMDTSFKKLIAIAEETGDTRNAILELEIKIEQMQGRVDNLNVERLKGDYQMMKSENKKLVKKLKEGKSEE